MPTTPILLVDESVGIAGQTGVTSNEVDPALTTLPVRFQDALAAESAGGGLTATALSGVDGTAAHASGSNVVNFTGTVTDVAFTNASGAPLDAVDSHLTTTSGARILLSASTFDDNVLIGRNENTGAAVFALYLDTGIAKPASGDGDPGATGAKLWVMQFGAIHHADPALPNDVQYLSGLLNVGVNTTSSYSLEGAPSGQNLFMMFGDGTPTTGESAIIATGKHPANQSLGVSITTGDTVNSGQGGGATTLGTNNQMIDPDEGLYFTFVKAANADYTVPNLNQNEADLEANIDFGSYLGASSASFLVSQLQPPKGASLKLTAYNNTDATEVRSTFIDGLGDSDDLLVNITGVTVTHYSKAGKSTVATDYTFTESSNTPAGGITVDFSGTTATIVGLQSGDRVSYQTATSHNRVLVDNIGNSDAKLNSSFDIDGFQVNSTTMGVTALGDVGFVDDAPTASAVLAAGTVVHDETAGVDSDANDTTAADVSALFASVSSASAQMAAGYAQGSASVVDSSASTGGVDGLAGVTYSLAVASAGVDSGLNTIDGHDILLYKEGDLVVGRVSGGADDGKAAFAVAINSSTGVLSLAQYNAIAHGNTASADEPVSINAAALLAVATATDGDGDTNSASVGIGTAVSFQDDGPAASAVLGAGTVTRDETAGVDSDANDTASSTVSALFSAVTTTSDQMTAGFAQGTASVLDAGAGAGGVDGLAGTTYAIGVSSAGVDSGLNTVDGHDILLYKEGDLVVGRISGGASDGKAAFAVAINSSTGVLSLAQYNAISHGDTGSADDPVSIAAAALVAYATATDGDGDSNTSSPVNIGSAVSFHDDGPNASAVLGTGTVAHDETPGVDSDANDTASASVSALFSFVTTTSEQMAAGFAQGGANVLDAGASTGGVDGLAGTSYSIDVSSAGVDSGLNTVDGHDILLYKEGDLVVGRISGGADDGKAAFAVAINSSTGVLSLAQYNALSHGNTGSADEPLSIAAAALVAYATATDGDGDTSTSSPVSIGGAVSFQDDGPSASAVLGAGTVAHDETAGVDSDANDTTSAAVSALFSSVSTASAQMTAGFAQGAANVLDAGASSGGVDGLTGLSYSLGVSSAGVDSGLNTVDGHDILLYKEGDLVVGRISGGADDGKAAFAVAIDSSTGVLSLAQYNALSHGNTGSADESLSIAAAALVAYATATDGDGDTSKSSPVNIGGAVSFQDDGPSASAVLGAGTVAHDETPGVDSDANDTTSSTVSALFSSVSTASTQMTAGFAQGAANVLNAGASSGGADGLAGTTYSIGVSSAGVDSGLNSVDGHDILLYKEGDLVVGRISGGANDGKAAFAVAIDSSTGVLSLAQYNAISHGNTGSADESVSIAAAALVAYATATDGDGDTSTSSPVNIGGAVSFQDDGPSASAMLGAGTVAHDETPGVDSDANDTTSSTVSALFSSVSTASTQMTAGFAQGSANVLNAGASSGGADGLAGLSYSLGVSSAGVDSGLNAVDGHDILLYKEGDLVVGRISGGANDGKAAFAVAINSSTGVLSLAQYNAISHGNTTNPDDSVSINAAALVAYATATDGDGDSSTSAPVGIGTAVSFQDDGPHAFTPATLILSNSGTASGTAALNAVGTYGTDAMGNAIFVDNYAANDYLYASGSTTTALTSGTQKIVLSGWGTSTLLAQTETSHLTVFTATLSASLDQSSITFSRKIDDGSEITTLLGASPVKQGNVHYNMLDNVGGTALDLLFSGTAGGSPSTVNVSSTGAGVANQTMNAGEMLRLDFEHGLALAGSPTGSDFTAGVHDTVNDFAFLVSQNTPSGTTATMLIKVYDTDDDKNFGNDTLDTITQIKVNGSVVYANGTPTAVSINGHTVQAVAYGGGVVLTGLSEGLTGDGTGGDDPVITVHTATGYSRVEITNYAGQTVLGNTLGGADFDIGQYGVYQPNLGNPRSFQLPVGTVDGDGDPSPIELIGITVQPVTP